MTITKEVSDHLQYICKHRASQYYTYHDGVIPYEDLLDEAHKGLLYAFEYFKEDAGRELKSWCTMIILRRLSQFTKQHKDKFKSTYEYTAENEYDDNSDSQEAKKAYVQQEIIQDNQKVDYVEAGNDVYFKWLLQTRKLNKREKDVLRFRYQGQLNREIAEVYNISTARVDQIYQKGIKVLKERHNRECKKVAR